MKKHGKPSLRKRFEILQRDGFQCRYCGSKPPRVFLEVDHIRPRSSGGSNDQSNLVTSCYECNHGKMDYHLDNPLILFKREKIPNNRLTDRQKSIMYAVDRAHFSVVFESFAVEARSGHSWDLYQHWDGEELYELD